MSFMSCDFGHILSKSRRHFFIWTKVIPFYSTVIAGNNALRGWKALLDFFAHFFWNYYIVSRKNDCVSSETNCNWNKRQRARVQLSELYTMLELDWKDKFNYRGEFFRVPVSTRGILAHKKRFERLKNFRPCVYLNLSHTLKYISPRKIRRKQKKRTASQVKTKLNS